MNNQELEDFINNHSDNHKVGGIDEVKFIGSLYGGTAAARPSAPKTRTVYFETDTNKLYVYNGSWVYIPLSATQIISSRVVDARCDDTINSGDATTDGVIDALRDAMIAHGLIAAA